MIFVFGSLFGTKNLQIRLNSSFRYRYIDIRIHRQPALPATNTLKTEYSGVELGTAEGAGKHHIICEDKRKAQNIVKAMATKGYVDLDEYGAFFLF